MEFSKGREDQIRRGRLTKMIQSCKIRDKVNLYKQTSTINHKISTHALSKNRLATFQRIQNRQLRQAYNDNSCPLIFNTEKLHRKERKLSQ